MSRSPARVKKRVPLPPPGDAPWTCAKGEKIHAASFEVAWEPGELKAVGSNGAMHAIRTTGPVAGLRLRREEGGKQLVYIWIEAVDSDGLVVPDATTEVKVAVEGAGRLLALDDGDHSTDLLFNVDTKKMKEGYLLAIVRRTGEGRLAISANGERVELHD